MRRVPSVLLPLAFLAVLGVPLLAEDPAPGAASPERLQTLITQLGAEDFRVREQASRDLGALGEAARPALQQAAKSSESLEVRWRAEQLIRRLDRQGERALEERPSVPRERVAPVSPNDPTQADMDRIRKLMEGRLGTDFGRFSEEFRRYFDEGFGPDRFPFGELGGGMGFFGSRRLEAPGLTLDIGMRGQVTLRVKKDDGSVETLREKSLEDLLAKRPDLRDHPGMADLQRRAQEKPRAQSMWSFGGMPGMTQGTIKVSSNGTSVEVTMEPGKAVATIRKKDDQGKETVRTVEGPDLEAIKKQDPEVAEALKGLGSMSIRVGPVGPPQVFPSPGGDEEVELPEVPAPEPLGPLPPSDPRPDVPFGIVMAPLETTLAYHLGIAEDAGILVVSVTEGSQAAAIGLQRHDVLLSIDGVPVRGIEETRTTLRAAAKSKAPLSLDVIRAGKRTNLRR